MAEHSDEIAVGPLKNLERSVLAAALGSTQPINEVWVKATGEHPMSAYSDFTVRLELLWFFLHLVNRMAFTAGGPRAREFIQDAVAVNAIREMISVPFDASEVKSGFDVARWRRRMVSDATDGLNEAELDYASCKALTGAAASQAFDEGNLLGKLTARIRRRASEGHAVEDSLAGIMLWRVTIGRTVMAALAEFGLKDHVERACRPLAVRTKR